MKHLWLVLLLACATEPEPQPEWVQTTEEVCFLVNGAYVCDNKPLQCWTNTRTGEINCDPEFTP